LQLGNGSSPEQIQLLLATDYTDAQLANAYRNLIIPPLTLGISIFFALLNLAAVGRHDTKYFGKTLGDFPMDHSRVYDTNLHRTLTF